MARFHKGTIPEKAPTQVLIPTAVNTMVRKPVTTGFWMGRLPHWEVEDGRYFITIHLHGAIPSDGTQRIEQLSQQLSRRPAVDSVSTISLMRTIFRAMEEWLDQTPHCAFLSIPGIAEMIMEAIEHRVRIGRWVVHEYVLMPSHLHLFLSVANGTLKESIEDFKRWTGHEAAKIVELSDGRFWQDEWFDHWSRSDDQDDRISLYIRRNPEAAGLTNDFSCWPFGSWRDRSKL